MTAHISLNNQTFGATPASRLAQFPRVHSQHCQATRSQQSVSRVVGQNALPTNNIVVIPSDEDSDVTDTENNNNETDEDDYLPSIDEIISRIKKEECSRSNTAAGSAAVSVTADPPSVESRKSSVNIQPHPLPVAGSHQAVPARSAAPAARTPTLSVAMAPREDEQPNQSGEVRSCEPRRLSVLHENTLQPVSPISQDTCPDPTPDTIQGLHHGENNTEQPEPGDELHTNSTNNAMIGVANSSPHQAEVTAENGYDDVEVGTPAGPTAATVPDHTPSRGPYVLRTRQAKHHLQLAPSLRTTATNNEDMPSCKRRKVAAPLRHSSRHETDHGRASTYFDRKQSTIHAHANFKEWPLQLQRTQANGHNTVQSSIRQDTSAEASASETGSANRGAERPVPGNTDAGSHACDVIKPVEALSDGVFDVERLVAKGRIGRQVWYMVKWRDYPEEENSWVRKRDIGLGAISHFEIQGNKNKYRVWERIVGKLEVNGRLQYEVKWQGQEITENVWVERTDVSTGAIKDFELRRR